MNFRPFDRLDTDLASRLSNSSVGPTPGQLHLELRPSTLQPFSSGT